VKIADGYVTDGTGPERVQQVIRVDPVGDHHHGRVRCGAADPAGRSDAVAGDAPSHQTDLWLLALGCSNCLLGVLGLRANVRFSAQRHPNSHPCGLAIRDQQRDTTHRSTLPANPSPDSAFLLIPTDS
jgi:hypothetical protein